MNKNRSTALLFKGALLFLTLLVSACNNTNKNALTPTAVDQNAELSKPTGVPQQRKIRKSGGTKIAVLVNNTPITNTDVKRRAAFVKLRKMRGNRTKIAREELIDEALKMQEARRINAVVSNKAVDAAYLRFAKGNKMSPQALSQILSRSGVTKRGFKQHIRATMSWQRAVGARLRSQGAGNEQTTGPAWLPAIGTKSTRENQYTLQQVVFIIPQSKRGSLLARRRLEAKRFRAKMNGCSNGRQLATGLKDVTVLDRGRTLESALPPQWRKEITSLSAGQTTRPRDTTKGVEIIAVCKKRDVIGNTNGGSENFLSADLGKQASALDKKYLSELKENAVIKYN